MGAMASHEGVIRWLGVPLMSFMSFPSALGVKAPPAAPKAPAPLEAFEREPGRDPAGGARYCRRLSSELTQCALFDGRGPEANLVGIEYLLSPAGYLRLPEEERAEWRRRETGFARSVNLRSAASTSRPSSMRFTRPERGRGA